VALDALVENVPRREAQLRLEQRDDPAREQEQSADEARRTRDVPAADTRRRAMRRS
jgi:hypothetical protein